MQNVFKTILWLNEKLMQHIECYTERFRQRCLTKTFFHLHSSSTSCSEMVCQGHFCKPIKIFGTSYLPFINGGTTLNNRSLLTSMTVCIELCGTADISSSIVETHPFIAGIDNHFISCVYKQCLLFDRCV